ncbi:hypothetical protein NW766_002085 [Fusarium irregulare]|uniref:Uncharacterized protein n=1 Tax=Fusarium irregulare TaxID=2494466 RepID=A0A9W8PY40_9HYPO|nr:hypothetical protein NW766_002085 [Fusarium irregulare]
MVTVWVSFDWLYRQWSTHTTPIAIGEDTTADKDCGSMKMANRFLQHEEDSRPRPFKERDRSRGGEVTAIHHWKGVGVPIKSGHILRFKVKEDEEDKFLQMLWVQWFLLPIAALNGVGNYMDTAGDTRDDEDKDADGTATPAKGEGGKGKSNTSTPTLTTLSIKFPDTLTITVCGKFSNAPTLIISWWSFKIQTADTRASFYSPQGYTKTGRSASKRYQEYSFFLLELIRS